MGGRCYGRGACRPGSMALARAARGGGPTRFRCGTIAWIYILAKSQSIGGTPMAKNFFFFCAGLLAIAGVVYFVPLIVVSPSSGKFVKLVSSSDGTWIADYANLIVQFSIWIALLVTLRAMQKASRNQNLIPIVELLRNKEQVWNRKMVMSTPGFEALADSCSDEPSDYRDIGLEVIRTYDVVGILIRSGVIEKDPIISNWGDSIQKCFERCKGIIERQKEEQHLPDNFWDDFEWLAKKSGWRPLKGKNL